jgi:ribonuclease HII
MPLVSEKELKEKILNNNLIKDSKKLTESQREKAYNFIKNLEKDNLVLTSI